MNLLSRSIKIAATMLLILIALCAAAGLAVRFLLAPNIEKFIPQLEQRLGRVTGQVVQVGDLAVDWLGIEPRLRVSGLQLTDHAGRTLLSVGEAVTDLDWSRVLQLKLEPGQVEVRDIRVNARRDREGRTWLLGRRIDSGHASASPEVVKASDVSLAPLSDMLRALPDLAVLNGSLSWLDENREAAGPLTLSDFTLQLTSSKGKRVLSASAGLPKSLGHSVQLLGTLQARRTDDGSVAWSGSARVSLLNLNILAVKPWFDVPAKVRSGKVTHAVVDVTIQDDLPTNMGVAYGLEDVRVEDRIRNHDFVIAADHLTSRLRSSFESVINEFNRWRLPLSELSSTDSSVYAPVAFESSVRGFFYRDTTAFENPLSIDQIDAAGEFGRNQVTEPIVNFHRVSIANQDLKLEGKGSWRFDPNSDNGIVDLTGALREVSLPQLHNYLPNVMDEDARLWLKQAFEQGKLTSAEFRLQGVVDDFPYGLKPDSGRFALRGTYENLLLNYHQRAIRGRRWPVVNSDLGTIHFRNDQIIIDSTRAFYTLPNRQRLDLSQFHGVVDKLEKHTTVDLQAEATGHAEDFLLFTRITPLGSLINHVLDEAEGGGTWTIPLQLHIPVLEADNSTISGTIRLRDGRFRLTPEFPWAEHLIGDLSFTEKELQAKQVKGRMLGGPVVLDGPIGTIGKPLSIRGTFSGDGLKELLPVKGMNRVSGRAAYSSQVNFLSGGRVSAVFSTDLKGLASRFPDGLSKPAAASWPTTVKWYANPGSVDNGKRYLEVQMDGVRTQAIFEHDVKSGKGPYFSRGTIAVDQPARLGQPGLTVLARNPSLDAQAWDDVVSEFSTDKGGASKRPTLPDVSLVSLETGAFNVHGQVLKNTRLDASRKGAQWDILLHSDQAAGTIAWIPPAGKDRQGSLTARLDSLTIGAGADQAVDTDSIGDAERRTMSKTEKPQEMPRLDVMVKQLTVQGMPLGQLILKGKQPSGSRDWSVDYLSLVNKGGSLAANGHVTQRGQARDLALQGKIIVSDLGQFLQTFHLDGMAKDGAGLMTFALDWADVDAKDLATLNGKLDFDLTDGRLETIKSKAVKALELLSLQSVKRLPQFGKTLGNSVQQGLSFDTARGRIRVRQGQLMVDDFRLNGPSSAIVASGNTDLKAESLNFQAVVVPKLDVSGASVLAGAIVNPAVGVGAFLTQWLLQAPLQRALTVRYHVTGTWSDPLLDDVALPTEQELKDQQAQKRIDDLYRSH